jgi:hypothetical protein
VEPVGNDLSRKGPHSGATSGWKKIERQMRKGLADWRSMLKEANVERTRRAFRDLLTSPIRLTPCVERGFRATRFQARSGWPLFSAARW